MKYSVKNYKRKNHSYRANFYKSEEEKQIKLELPKKKVKAKEKFLKHWEEECKSTEARAKDEFEKKVEWFKENWMVEKTHHKPQNLLHERNNEYKMKERRNPWKEQLKRKLNGKETSSDQLKSQQDQGSTNDIASAPSDDTLVETLDAISNNNFDKDLENSVITSSSTTDQQPDHIFIGKPVSLGAGENKTKSLKTMTKPFSKKTKRKHKTEKKHNQHQLTTKISH